jgi:beta-hydroxylase
LNYGLLYDGVEFKENILQCPQTYKMLEKIKDKINIAGFSYMKGKSMIQKHTDSTGIMYDSLAFHLGLIIPEPHSTCQLIISDGYKKYSYIERPGGTVIFDGTYEHYAYNQSSEDRVILYIDFKI